jgi:hypothetical protein
MTAGRDARYSRIVMKALQPTRRGRLALAIFLTVLLRATTPGAQSSSVAGVTLSGPILEQLSRRGVFEGEDEVDHEHGARVRPVFSDGSSSSADDRIRWLTFYLLYTDDTLSSYAPSGAMGARLDVFQFAGFPDAQPRGYPTHILVRDGRSTLTGVVRTAGDEQLAEARAREIAGVLGLDNALVIAQ